MESEIPVLTDQKTLQTMKITKQPKTERIVLRITEFEKNQLTRMAFNENKTITQIVRRSLYNENIFSTTKHDLRELNNEYNLMLVLVNTIVSSQEKPVLIDAEEVLSLMCDIWDIDLTSKKIRNIVEQFIRDKYK